MNLEQTARKSTRDPGAVYSEYLSSSSNLCFKDYAAIHNQRSVICESNNVDVSSHARITSNYRYSIFSTLFNSNRPEPPKGEFLEDVNGVYIPLRRSLEMAGCNMLTVTLIRDIVYHTYNASGRPGVAQLISDWNVAVRIILAAEPHTALRVPIPGIRFARTAKNSIRLLSRLHLGECRPVPISIWKFAIKFHGGRAIPPFLMDPALVWGLLPKPTYSELSKLVSVSNIKRLLWEGDSEKMKSSLAGFKTNVERSIRPFNLRKVAGKLNYLYGLNKSSNTENSRIDISFKSSLDFTQRNDGKIGEFLSKVIHDFMERSIYEIFPIPPEHDLFDMFGIVILRVDDWALGAKVGATLYNSIYQSDDENMYDKRLGYIALYWAFITVNIEENIILECDCTPGFPFCKYFESARVQYLSGSIRARVSPQPEEGFKVRTLTIVSLAVAFIGATARHLLDPDMLNNPEIRVGLRTTAKLYYILDLIGGLRTADPVGMLYNCTPHHAESVDLTTATDTSPRPVIHDVLHGHLDSIHHSTENFLRFAVDIATCRREFIMPPTYGGIPPIHRSGIMMGESLSGIFLNDSSMLIRSLAPFFYEYFPAIRGIETFTSNEADLFIEENRADIQYFLDTVRLVPNRCGTQSGDDVVNFSNESLSVSFRILYRVWGNIPSEQTWFSSDRYCTFTEEAAIRTFDSNGWKFVDSVKPRVFQDTTKDPTGSLLVSRISLLSDYLKYVPTESHTFQCGIRMADEMLNSHETWRRIMKTIDVGLPSYLGGINHPMGICKDYHLTLDMEDLSIIKGLMSLTPFEAYNFIWEAPELIRNSPAEIELALILEGLLLKIQETEIFPVFIEGSDTLVDLEEAVPKGATWRDRLRLQGEFCKEHGLRTVGDLLDEVSNRTTLALTIETDLKDKPCVKAWNICKRRKEKLRCRFPTSEFPVSCDDIASLSVSKLKEQVELRMNSIALPKSLCSQLVDLEALPSLSLRFVHEVETLGETGT